VHGQHPLKPLAMSLHQLANGSRIRACPDAFKQLLGRAFVAATGHLSPLKSLHIAPQKVVLGKLWREDEKTETFYREPLATSAAIRQIMRFEQSLK
jgi:hypothetical protein